MENVKYKSLGDSFIDNEGGAIEVTQIIDDFFDRKIKMEITTKSLPKALVELPKKNLKNHLN